MPVSINFSLDITKSPKNRMQIQTIEERHGYQRLCQIYENTAKQNTNKQTKNQQKSHS